ncbi:helix-turn-helix domain-containing protein [Sinomicrobium sp. M5D2P9]
MQKEQPSYYSVLPAPVRYDKRLTPNAKILYAEITSLTNQLGFCYATNRYFEELFQVSTQPINFWLKQLEDLGYIQRHLYRDEGTKEILNRYISIFEKPIQAFFRDNTKEEILNSNNYKKKNFKKRKVNPRKP